MSTAQELYDNGVRLITNDGMDGHLRLVEDRGLVGFVITTMTGDEYIAPLSFCCGSRWKEHRTAEVIELHPKK